MSHERPGPINSLVIPVYQNAENIPALHQALIDLHRQMTEPWEVVYVIDGSPDASEYLLRERLAEAPYPSQLICHARNFGSAAAIRTGLAHARGSRLAVMAADLQEPPELMREFFRVLRDEPVDVCLGTRSSREDPWATKLSSQLFWRLYRRLVMPQMPRDGIDVFACRVEVARVLLSLQESHSFLPAQLLWVGFRRKEIPYHRQARTLGRSSWTFRKRFEYMLNSVFAFTDRPLRLISLIGGLGMTLSLGYGLFVTVARLRGWITEAGFTTLVLLILFSMSLNLFSLGIVGQYIWRTFENSKGRPASIVRRADCFEPASAPR